MAITVEERAANHRIRKTERADAIGIPRSPQPISVVTVVEKTQLSKEEQDLLRSMALTVEDNPWQRIQFTNKFNSLAPTYDPTSLQLISYQNNTLRQCIAAMISNIDGTGFEIKRKDGGKIIQVVSPDSPKPPPQPKQPIPNPTALPKSQPGGTGFTLPAPPPKPMPKVGQPWPPDATADPILMDPPDVAKLKAFWDEPYPGVSFKTMRKRLRDDLETTGNAYLEVIRDQSGNIALLNPMDAKLTRLIRHDDNPVAVEETINRSGVPGEEQKVTLLVHERRYVQIIGLNARFFKAYKATRELNAQTGIWSTDSNEMILPQDKATEVIHFMVDRDVLTPYGIPRWINQIPSVMGSRKAEELNLEFFNHGGIPPAIIMIQGGTLSPQGRTALTGYLSGQAKFKQRGVVMEIASSSGDLNSASQVKVTTEKFGDTEHDSKFEAYDDKCTQRVRSSFRLPAVLIGLEESYNYATVQTAVMTAEDQVFHPERVLFDEIINSTIMKELDEEGIYLFESKRMTAKFLDEQIKALTIAKGLVDGKSLVDAINDIVGLDLKFDEQADAIAKQTAQAGVATALAGGAGPGGQAGTGDPGESTAGGGAGFNGLGKTALKKSSTALDGSSTAIDPNNAAQVTVQVTAAGRIRKLDHTLLTGLADDMAGYMTGERHFLAQHVSDMHKLVKSMTLPLQRLFAENVAQKIMNATHDPNGISELISCASDVMAKIAKAGEATPTPKVLKFDQHHDSKGRFATTDAQAESTAYPKIRGVNIGIPAFPDAKEAASYLESHHFWHGTAAALKEAISKEGLVPAKGMGGDTYAKKINMFTSRAIAISKGRTPSVFMTPSKEVAEQFADYAKLNYPGSQKLVLEIEVPVSEWPKFKQDELDYRAVRFEDTIKPEWIKSMTVEKTTTVDPTHHKLYAVIMIAPEW